MFDAVNKDIFSRNTHIVVMQNRRGDIEGEYESSQTDEWSLALSYINERTLAKNEFSNLCFLRMKSKKECQRTHMYKFSVGNIHYGNKFLVN